RPQAANPRAARHLRDGLSYLARQAAAGPVERDQAGLQRVIDVGLAGEIAGDGRQRIVELAAPAAVAGVDQPPRGEIPEAAIPGLASLAEEMRGPDALADRPPQPVAHAR